MREQVKKRWCRDDEGRYHEEEYKTGKLLFDEEDKIRIVSEYVASGCPAQEIVGKYHLGSRQVLFSWMDRYVNEWETVSLPEREDDMSRKSPGERIRELEAENKRLRKAYELENLRAEAYGTMIDLAEKTFNIPVRKKSGAKR